MADEKVRTQKIQRGNAAALLMDNPVLQEAFKDLRARNYELYCGSEMREDEVRLKVWAIAKAIDLVEEQLSAYQQIGVMEHSNRLEDQGKKE